MKNCILSVFFDGFETIRFAPKNVHNLVEAKAWFETHVKAPIETFNDVELLSVEINGSLYNL
jgi:hypothetical protein